MLEPARDPYGHALDALRRFTLEGRFGWGEPIVVKDLAAEIGLSPTPIREALACLAGEGLIRRRRGKGYFFPALTGPDIIDLFDLEWTFVHAALTLHPPASSFRLKLAAAPHSCDYATLFRAIMGQTGNECLTATFDRLTEQLRPVRDAQTALGHVHLPESRELAAAIGSGSMDLALSLLKAHQHQRCELASEVARFLQRAARKS